VPFAGAMLYPVGSKVLESVLKVIR
jgi:hypothetical protein